MDLELNYEIIRVANFIRSGNFTRVALQFPDELLKDSTKVVSALREKLRSSEQSCTQGNGDVKLYVMADTTYGSCCIDEVGASHINADCVIHFGHTCLSPTSNLPALYIFGKSSISASTCAKSICSFALTSGKPILILFGLEYAHAIDDIKESAVAESINLCGSTSQLQLHYADVMCSVVNPSEGHLRVGSCADGCGNAADTRYSIGGLTWSVPGGQKIEDYSLFWIGSDNPAFSNVVLTFNGCEIGTYLFDIQMNSVPLYYLVEKAKDAGIVGILVGTLGVAGYLHMIHQMKQLITTAGKKAYTLVMGRPNPAKLANFPECDVFIYVSCAQTALLDSKEFLAPVITPFEALLAFNRGSQWTGAYVMEFRDLITSAAVDTQTQSKEARFSFLQGGYVEDFDSQENRVDDKDEGLALANVMDKALQVSGKDPHYLIKGRAKSGAEFLAARSFQGLDIHSKSSLPEPVIIGRTGKASGYADEASKLQAHGR
ncbi:hypothetical protein RJ639_033959 [Escallonia herrerae]|uniref:2-(3-amino-3-carboxypropyl)histidine synthase subunit 2 n=1 Tax=Escallonia herrerae TaxID=1293975 RepID=A0AA88X4H1_9ASTE|nr:hypothetical protein RJ639_033959 [Escallonia herrerae]